MQIKIKKIRRLIVAIAAVLMIAVLGMHVYDIVRIPREISWDPQETGYIESDNGRFVLDLDGSTGYFNLTDTVTGTSTANYPTDIDSDEDIRELSKQRIRSMIELTVLEVKTKALTTINSGRASLEQGGLTTTREASSWKLSYYFPSEKITVELVLEVSARGLSFQMDPSSIKEEGDYMVMDITVMPFFLSGDSAGEKEGYLIVPDGSGAMIRFPNNRPGWIGYSQKVYDTDSSIYRDSDVEVSKGIRMPFLGVRNESGAILGIITEGAADAVIAANTDLERTSYINVCPQFILREKDKIVYDDNRADVDLFQMLPIYLDMIRIDYFIETAANAEYAQMASMYREYIIDRYGLTKIDQTESNDAPFFLDIYGSTIRKKQYLGIPLDSVKVLTTYDQAAEMIAEIGKYTNGMIIRFMNGTTESAWRKTPRDLTPLTRLGGRSGLRSLSEISGNAGGSLYLGSSLNTYAKGSTIFSPLYEAAKNMRREPVSLMTYKPNTYTEDDTAPKYTGLTNSRTVAYAEIMAGKFEKFNVGAAPVDYNTLYRDFANTETTLTKTLRATQEAMSVLASDGKKIASNGGYEFELQFSEAAFELPSGDSVYDITDSRIPFMQIALHGLIPYAIEPVNTVSDPHGQFLRTIETGAGIAYRWTYAAADAARYSYDSFLINSHYEAWVQDATERNTEVRKALKGTAGRFITGHEFLLPDVTMTTYDNGYRVIVNYSEDDKMTTFGNVSARSYMTIEGGDGR